MALPAVLLGAMGRAAGAATAAGGGAARSGVGSLFKGSGPGGGAGALFKQAGDEANKAAPKFRNLGQQIQMGAHAVSRFASSISDTAVKAMTAWIGVVDHMAAPIAKLVQVANPAVAERFYRALADAYAVVGHALTPVMEAFTRAARKVGDVMAGLEPTFRPVMQAVERFIDTTVGVFGRLVEKQAPVFELMANVFTKVADAATFLVRVFGGFIDTFNGISRTVAQLLGFKGDSFDKNATSQGQAFRQSRMTQPKGIADEAIKNAIGVGLGQKPKPPELTALEKIEKHTDAIRDWLTKNRPPTGPGDAAKSVVTGEGVVGRVARNVSPAAMLAQSIRQGMYGKTK